MFKIRCSFCHELLANESDWHEHWCPQREDRLAEEIDHLIEQAIDKSMQALSREEQTDRHLLRCPPKIQ